MTADWAKDPIMVSANNTCFPSHCAHWANNVAELAGVSGRSRSWLLDREALTSDFALLKQSSNLITHVIGGSALRDTMAKRPSGSNAVLPAWWRTYAHLGKSRLPSH